MTLLSAVDMSRVLGMLSPLVPRQAHLILYASPDTELANSPRPWGQERSERVLGLGLACHHHSQGNTTQMCVQNPRMSGTSHGTNLGREDGELVTDSTSGDIDTEPSSSCLDILARRNQIENKSKCILVQHTTRKPREEPAAPRHKEPVSRSCEHRSSCVFKVSLSSAAGPPTPNPTEGVTAPAGVWCHNHCAGQARGTAAGLGAMHPFLMGTCRSYPVSMCPGSCCLKAFWESHGWIGSFGFIFGQLVTTKIT